MILLVTPIQRSNECAAALKAATGEPVVVAANLLDATTLLRAQSFRAAVFDQHQVEREPQETEIGFAHLGDAVPIKVNLSVSNVGRLVREVQAALRRQLREQANARQAAARALHGELNNTMTELLLQFEVALKASDLSAEAAEKLLSVQAVAEKLRSQLESTAVRATWEGG